MDSDQDRLRQVLINLLSNAVKFTDTGSVTVRAHREAGNSRGARDDLVISVADTGIGIPKDKLETVFDEFSQVKTDRTQTIQGTGLGLSICRSLTELMGGRISAESEEGKGSVFTVRIPMVYAGAHGAEGQQ